MLLPSLIDPPDGEAVAAPDGSLSYAGLIADADAELPEAVASLPRVEPRAGAALPDEPDDSAPAIVLYTSGTTGPPKGAVLSRAAIAHNLDALAEAWDWTAEDVLAHA